VIVAQFIAQIALLVSAGVVAVVVTHRSEQ